MNKNVYGIALCCCCALADFCFGGNMFPRPVREVDSVIKTEHNQLVLAIPTKIENYWNYFICGHDPCNSFSIYIGGELMDYHNDAYPKYKCNLEESRWDACNFRGFYNKIITDLLHQKFDVARKLFAVGRFTLEQYTIDPNLALITFDQSYEAEEFKTLAIQLVEAIKNIEDCCGNPLGDKIGDRMYCWIPGANPDLINKKGKTANSISTRKN
jgi:hypothetical protein